MDWSSYFPHFVQERSLEDAAKIPCLQKDVEIVDIGCGFGGLLVALGPKLPEKLILGELYRNNEERLGANRSQALRFEHR